MHMNSALQQTSFNQRPHFLPSLNNLFGSSMELATSTPALGSRETVGKIRLACNRCHYGKLRCLKKAGQVSCERCLKLKTTCRSGTRAPRASLRHSEEASSRPQRDSYEPVSGSTLAAPDPSTSEVMTGINDFNWPLSPNMEMDLAEGQFMLQPNICSSMQGGFINLPDADWFDHYDPNSLDLTPINGNFMGFENGPLPYGLPESSSLRRIENQEISDRAIISSESPVRRLANLNVALSECASELPSLARTGVDFAGPTNDSQYGSRKSRRFVIDELFRSTTEFLNILKHLSRPDPDKCTSFPPTDPRNGSAASLFPSIQSLSQTTTPATSTSSFSHLDEATTLLIASCHAHLTEIYQSIIHMIQCCCQHTLVPEPDQQWAVVLPRLDIGSLRSDEVCVDANTLLEPKMVEMYILMVLMGAGRLWGKMGELIRESGVGGLMGFRESERERDGLVDVVWERVRERTERLVEMIDEVRGMLQGCSVPMHG